jgi:asparagine synthase (glutamine-hydrolysing)
MCGIFSLLNYNNYDIDFIKEQFLKGQSRGPEDTKMSRFDNNVLMGFHRLAINGLNSESNQPLDIHNIVVICNGEIYNYKQLYKQINITPKTDSDCEVIIYCYLKYGIEYTLQMLDGVFAIILFDIRLNKIYATRDPFGIRPMFVMNDKFKKGIGFSSELKQLNMFSNNVSQVTPGHFYEYNNIQSVDSYGKMVNRWCLKTKVCYHRLPFYKQITKPKYDVTDYIKKIRKNFEKAVKKRVETSDRPIACLLSGGLDSSLVCSIVSKYIKTPLKTFSIGLADSEDLKYARKVASFLGTDHSEIVVTEKDFFDVIPEVIKTIESYDTTTVRASAGNYLLGKYIKEHSECKVIFNGDGSDELAGGYLYFHKAPDMYEFDKECRRLLHNIHCYDVLRSDRCISVHGLEPRTPFLDRSWVDFYLSIPIEYRCHTTMNKCEKFLIRKAFEGYLPDEVLWRKKEAFSDGVSGLQKSWYQIIQEHIDELPKEETSKMHEFIQIECNKTHNKPITNEQKYYRYLFEKNYKSCEKVIPYFWMPKYVEATDSSARTLDVYKKV